MEKQVNINHMYKSTITNTKYEIGIRTTVSQIIYIPVACVENAVRPKMNIIDTKREDTTQVKVIFQLVLKFLLNQGTITQVQKNS